MKPTVFIPEPIAAPGVELLRRHCHCRTPWEEGVTVPPEPDAAGAAPHRAAFRDADAALVRLFQVGADDIRNARRLKVIGKHGVGVDNIDCEAATSGGLPVVYTPGSNGRTVAEHAMALMLALSRQIYPSSHAIRSGTMEDRNRFQGVELAGKNLGLIGLGRIGSRVAGIASGGFGMKVRAYDPFLPAGSTTGAAVLEDSLTALLGWADFISLHVPLSDETHHLIDQERLKLMKPGCRLVNTSRGPVIDESALARALREGRLAGAALDVFEEEPLSADHPLCGTPNTLLTPHISGLTDSALERASLMAAQGILDVLQGRRPEHVANPGYSENHD